VLPPNSPVSRKFIARRRPSGFSLVEVVLAVGVISFAFVAILGLLPAGLHQFRQAMDTSISSQIAQRIIQDAQQSDFDVLTEILPPAKRDPNSIVPFTSMVYPAGGGSRAVRYFDEQGNEVVPKGTTASATELADIVYTVNTRIQPWPTLPGTTTPDTSATTVGKSLVTMTVQVAFNPGGRPFKLDGTTQLIDLTDPKMKTLSIKNYSAQIGRND
jgi:uncharacterized protein (TIGR02598 family)